MKFNILMTLSLFLFISCGSYKTKITNRLLGKEDINQLDGMYSAMSIQDSFSYTPERWHVYGTNFLEEIDRQKKDDTLSLTITKNYSFNLKVESPKNISIQYIENDSVFRVRDVKMKVRNNGYVQLKNKNLIIKGIPPFFWAYDQKKIRLTIDEDKHLVMDTALDCFGSFLLMVGGNSSSHRYRFKRINE